MNIISAVDTSYLRSSRTIETVLIKNSDGVEKIVYVYNFEGWHFRVFNNIVEIIHFFDDNFEPNISFEDENELDLYLMELNY